MKIDRLHIERLGARADGIGQWERQDVFVPFALPGETVSGTLDGNRLTDVKILEVVEDRIKPACRQAGKSQPSVKGNSNVESSLSLLSG